MRRGTNLFAFSRNCSDVNATPCFVCSSIRDSNPNFAFVPVAAPIQCAKCDRNDATFNTHVHKQGSTPAPGILKPQCTVRRGCRTAPHKRRVTFEVDASNGATTTGRVPKSDGDGLKWPIDWLKPRTGTSTDTHIHINKPDAPVFDPSRTKGGHQASPSEILTILPVQEPRKGVCRQNVRFCPFHYGHRLRF